MYILECTKSDYLITAFVIPVLSIFFLLVLFMNALWKLVRSYRDSEPLRKAIHGVVSVLITLVLLFCAHFPTFRYGVFLPTVTDSERQYSQGYVSNITEVPFSPRYSISGNPKTYRASYVQINGEQFYFLIAENLKVGQEVVISFLPKCNMVLTCMVIRE